MAKANFSNVEDINRKIDGKKEKGDTRFSYEVKRGIDMALKNIDSFIDFRANQLVEGVNKWVVNNQKADTKVIIAYLLKRRSKTEEDLSDYYSSLGWGNPETVKLKVENFKAIMEEFATSGAPEPNPDDSMASQSGGIEK